MNKIPVLMLFKYGPKLLETFALLTDIYNIIREQISKYRARDMAGYDLAEAQSDKKLLEFCTNITTILTKWDRNLGEFLTAERLRDYCDLITDFIPPALVAFERGRAMIAEDVLRAQARKIGPSI